MHSINYYKMSLSYYDTAFDINQNSLFKPTLPDPFPKFISPGEYNGIKLTQRLMKKIFINFMTIHEPYMQ